MGEKKQPKKPGQGKATVELSEKELGRVAGGVRGENRKRVKKKASKK